MYADVHSRAGSDVVLEAGPRAGRDYAAAFGFLGTTLWTKARLDSLEAAQFVAWWKHATAAQESMSISPPSSRLDPFEGVDLRSLRATAAVRPGNTNRHPHCPTASRRVAPAQTFIWTYVNTYN